MKNLFKSIGNFIAEENFNALHDLQVEKPVYFNWVTEIFEGINVKEHPDKTALLWTDGTKTEHYTFQTLHNRYNQLLNFLRQKGIQQQDVILTQMMLQRINWVTLYVPDIG